MSLKNESDKLEWMYRNANEIVDREEYLLGRRLDKNADNQSSSTANESIPSSIFSLPESTNRIDAVRKIKEDPLEMIKEKEREMRKELLKNPIQMKKIKKMIESQKKKIPENEPKKKKKDKKKKRRSKEESDCDSQSEKELDAILSKKLAKLIKKYGNDILNSDDDKKVVKNKSKKINKKYDSSSDDKHSSEDYSDNDRSNDSKKRSKGDAKYNNKSSKSTRKRSPSSSDSSSEESEEDDRSYAKRKKKEDEYHNVKSKKEERNSREKFKHNFKDNRKTSEDYKSNENKSFGLYVPKGARKASDAESFVNRELSHSSKGSSSKNKNEDRNYREKERRRDRSRDDRGKNVRDDVRKRRSRERDDGGRNRGIRKSGMTEEEKERRLKEMMDNVSWRNELMNKNIKRHNEELKKEETQHQNYDENFTRNQLSKGIYSESVEKRIKSNMQNIQRSKFAMDKNFARR